MKPAPWIGARFIQEKFVQCLLWNVLGARHRRPQAEPCPGVAGLQHVEDGDQETSQTLSK